jgi:hypothetical protein
MTPILGIALLLALAIVVTVGCSWIGRGRELATKLKDAKRVFEDGPQYRADEIERAQRDVRRTQIAVGSGVVSTALVAIAASARPYSDEDFARVWREQDDEDSQRLTMQTAEIDWA